MYNPLLEIVPTELFPPLTAFTAQVTELLFNWEGTLAVNCWLWFGNTDACDGVICIANTVNVLVVNVPLARVTVIGPLLAFAGTVAVICVRLPLNTVALVPLNETLVMLPKFAPVKVTVSPINPDCGENEINCGLGQPIFG